MHMYAQGAIWTKVRAWPCARSTFLKAKRLALASLTGLAKCALAKFASNAQPHLVMQSTAFFPLGKNPRQACRCMRKTLFLTKKVETGWMTRVVPSLAKCLVANLAEKPGSTRGDARSTHYNLEVTSWKEPKQDGYVYTPRATLSHANF